jgi:glycosyltransferase involved in cell wall biosynthesis
MAIDFMVPGSLDQLTGGYLFDRHIVDGLRAMGRAVSVHELGGSFPDGDAVARRAAAQALADLDTASVTVIDGLALPAFADCLPDAAGRFNLVGFVHHVLALETGLSLERREALALVEARLLPRLNGILCPSRTTAWHLEELGVAPERIAITPPGTNRPIAARGTRPAGPLRLLSVGTVTPRKGHLTLIEALAELADRPWELLIIGSLARDPETVAALKDAIARHALGGRVTLAGEWPPERLGVAYRQADLFVLPSYHEGYGMAFAEALAHGLPIVATTGGAIPETVPATAAMLVPPGDPAARGRGRGLILDKGALRARLAEGAARAGAALPDWPAATRRWIDSFDRLVAGTRGD